MCILILLTLSTFSMNFHIPDDVKSIEIIGHLSGVYLTIKSAPKGILKVVGIEPTQSIERGNLILSFHLERKNPLNLLGIERQGVDIRLPSGIPATVKLEGNGSLFIFDADQIELKKLDLSVGSGSIVVTRSQDSYKEMELLRLSVSLGKISVIRLGDFGAKVIEISCGAGKIDLDLTGSWKGKPDFSLFSTFGEVKIQKPKNISLHFRKSGIFNPGLRSLNGAKRDLFINFMGSINRFSIKEVR